MIPLVSAAYATDLDRRMREDMGVPAAALMENAASGMESSLRSLGLLSTPDDPNQRITALAGKGSNGGDALAVLRRIAFRTSAGRYDALTVVLASGEPAGLAAEQLRAVRSLGIGVLDWEKDADECRRRIERSSLLLDGVAGTGLSGPLRPRQASLVEFVNASGVPIAAVDVPSGVGDGISGDAVTAVKARVTLCVAPLKACLYRPALRPLAGTIIPISGVFPAASGSESPVGLSEIGDLAAAVPPFRAEGHKYDRGYCLVFAGDRGTTGAAVLAARGTAAGGAGLVALYARPEIWPIVASRLDGEMARPLPDDPEDIDLSRARAAVIGPGWGRDSVSSALLRRLWASPLPLVLDADALALLAEQDLPGRAAPTVLTPHPGEAAAMSGKPVREFLGDPEEALRRMSERWGAVVALKSCVTWVRDPRGSCAVWDGMDASLAVGGSGDVLAGVCGALLARGLSAFDAARAAVTAHGLAGMRAREELGIYGADALPSRVAAILGGLHGE